MVLAVRDLNKLQIEKEMFKTEKWEDRTFVSTIFLLLANYYKKYHKKLPPF